MRSVCTIELYSMYDSIGIYKDLIGRTIVKQSKLVFVFFLFVIMMKESGMHISN